MTPKRLAILTSGGDAPGMNAAIRAATLVGVAQGWTVLGVERGYTGLIEGEFRPLEPGDVGGIIRDGGTVLGSTRCLPFTTPEGRATARRRLADARIGAVLVIGGNGSLAGAASLADLAEDPQAPRVIGLPASIDNDVGVTSLAIGVDTAMNTIMEACDRIADTASAHDRAFIVEVMGRDSGYLAMATSVAVGADLVLFREDGRSVEAHVERVVEAIVAARRRPTGRRRALIIKAEGVALPALELKARVDARLRAIAGDVAETEVRVTVLGHVVRGGRPTAFDRMMASRLGHAGVRALIYGASRAMVAWAPALTPDDATRSAVDPRCWHVPLDTMLAETRRLLTGESPTVQWRTRVFDVIDGALKL
ncbi:MAG: 6-phosphofructokinase [Myxococcales bacterium]|nr:6-phosphofructokinase [Myxococcales bacterium]